MGGVTISQIGVGMMAVKTTLLSRSFESAREVVDETQMIEGNYLLLDGLYY